MKSAFSTLRVNIIYFLKHLSPKVFKLRQIHKFVMSGYTGQILDSVMEILTLLPPPHTFSKTILDS